MFNLSQLSLSDMIECGAALRQLGQDKRSMEEVAERIVRYLYDHLVDGRTGERACALVRFWKTHPYGGLDEDLRRFAREMLGRPPESPALKCLILLATAGDRPEWNRRERSRKHKAIPLSNEETIQQAPLIVQLFGQFELGAAAILHPDPDVLLDLEQRTYNVFHVPRARDSPSIPAQDEFVVPFGIESVLGFGGVLPAGDLFAVNLFSRVPISRATAELFRPLALHVKLAVLPFDGGPVFAPADSAAAARDGVTNGDRTDEDARRLRSRAAALEQLLEVHERSVREQAGALEQALAEARQLLESAPDPIVITDDWGRVVRVNQQAEAAFGYSREELLGRPAELLVPEGFRPREGASGANSRQGAGPRPRDQRPDLYGQRKDGSRFPVDLTLNPLEEVDGPLVIGIIRDTTARRRAERRLATQLATTCVLAKAATLAEATPRVLQAIGEGLGWDFAASRWVDPQDQVLRCVATWYRPSVTVSEFDALTRASTFAAGDEFPGRIWASGRPAWIADVTRDGDFSRAPAAVEAGLHGAFGFPIQLRGAILGVVEFFSREVQPVDDALLAMADGLGSQIGQFTERKRFEEQLLKLSRAVEQSASLVIIADTAGRIEYVNPKFTQVTGYASAEVLGQNPRILKSGETPPREYQRLWEAITSGGEWRGEFHNKKKDGGLYWASESISPVRNPQGTITHFVAIQDDITDLKEAQRRALQAERLAAIGQMMAGLAHESRNALQRGQACLEMLSRRLTGPEALDLVAGIQEAQDDLHRLYEEVRSYAAPVLLERRRCHLRDVLHEAWARLESTRQGREARLSERGLPDLVCQGDHFHLEQVFRNILDNALAACHDPVEIDIEWAEVDCDGQPAVRVAMRDHGPGLTAEQRRNLFEPFYTTKTRGTGLGLAIARRIVETHGGRIEVGPGDCRGSTILITLPRG